MIVFLDTSAVLAVLDTDEEHHKRASAAWERLIQSGAQIITSNYVVVETCALLQRRFGLEAVRTFCSDIEPMLRVEWVTQAQHGAARMALLTAARRKLSLVDCTSFQLMRELGVSRAFSFDRHFRELGFEIIP